ncbi:MAG: N-acetylneuraminate synthase family protein [Chloroflexi bacterium]|nr:N-acetylneuraminate synthase family protein [Chloroflexota bacterium]
MASDGDGSVLDPVKQRVTIVAEGAQGFEGACRQAELIVRAAAAGGADVVKLQLVYADELAVPGYRWYGLFRDLEMDDGEWGRVAEEARRLGVRLAFDVYGERSLALATRLGAVAVKIHSTDFFNGPLVDAAIATGLDVWFSIGGITVDELEEFLEGHPPRRADQLTLLYGFQAEPTANEDNHMNRIGTLGRRFPGLSLGFMDHAAGTADEAGWFGVLALPFGVRVIEKHITVGRGLGLEDDVSALDAADFARYVGRIRAAEAALGSSALVGSDAERAYRNRALKAVLAARDLPAGTLLTPEDLMLKRGALSEHDTPLHRIDQVAGRTLTRAVVANTPIGQADLG